VVKECKGQPQLSGSVVVGIYGLQELHICCDGYLAGILSTAPSGSDIHDDEFHATTQRDEGATREIHQDNIKDLPQ
jgi:hypothetical protein